MTDQEIIFHAECDLIQAQGKADLDRIHSAKGLSIADKIKMILQVNDRVIKAMEKAHEEMKKSLAIELANKYPN